MDKKQKSSDLEPRAGMTLLNALIAAGAALQQSAHSEDQVFRVFREQLRALRLRGGLSFLDASGEMLTIKAVVQPPAMLRVMRELQARIGLASEGFTVPVARVDVYRQVIAERQTIFLADISSVVAQLLPAQARPFAQLILKTFGASPGIFAPLVIQDRAQGILNIAGANLTPEDIAPMEAFVNHIAIALENARLFASLRASEERFRALIEQGSDVLIILTPEGVVRYASPSVKRILGYDPAATVGKTIFEFAHADDVQTMTDALRHRVAHPGAANSAMQIRARAHDGSWRVWEVIGNNQLDNPAVGGIVLTCRDITERAVTQDALRASQARLLQAERERAVELEAVRQATLTLTSSLDLQAVLNSVLEGALELAGDAKNAHIFLYQDDRLMFGSARNADGRAPAPFAEPRQDGLTYQVARRGEPIVVPDMRAHPLFANAPHEWSGAIIGLPLKIGARVVGVMNLSYAQPRNFPETHLRVLRLLGDQAAIAIENARLFDNAQSRAREFAALYETARDLAGQRDVSELLKTILERATTLLDAPDGVIYLYDAARAELVNAANSGLPIKIGARLNITEGASSVVVQTREPILLDDYQTWEHRRREYADLPIHAVVQVPILHGGELIGVLGVAEIENRARKFTDADLRLLSLFASQAASAVHHARLLVETQQRADVFAALYETTRDLAAQHDVPTLLQTIVERAATLLAAPGGGIYLYDRTRGDLQVVVAKGSEVSIGARLQLGEGMAGRVAQTRLPLIVDDYHTWEGRSPQYASVPFTAVLEVPMLFGGELIGVLTVHEIGEGTRKFTDADAHLLSLFASQAASALRNARLFSEANTRAEQLALVYDAGLTLNRVLDPREQLGFLFQTAIQALRADRATFYRYDSARGKLEYGLNIGYAQSALDKLRELSGRANTGEGILGWVLQKRLPLYVADVQTDSRYIVVDPAIRCGIWMPIEHEDELRGILGITSTRVDGFSPQDQRLLALFANQAAVAMENARLFEETQRRLTELETVNRVSVALRAADTIEEMLPLLVSEIAAVLGAASATIWLYDRAQNELRQATRWGFPDIPISLKPGEGIAGQVMATGEPYIAREFKTDPHTDARAREIIPPGLAGACVPIRTGQEFAGVLFVSVQQPREIHASHVRLMTTVAEIAGNAIHRMRLHEQTRHRAAQLAAVNTLGHTLSETRNLQEIYARIARATFELLPNITIALIALFDPARASLNYVFGIRDGETIDPQTLALQAPGFGAESEAIRTRRPVIVDDLSEHLRAWSVVATGAPPLQFHADCKSVLCVPMFSTGNVIGVIQTQSCAPNRFSAADAELIELVANAAASEIENARLFAELADAYDETIKGWAQALDLRDKETQGHTRRVVEQTAQLARAMGMPAEEMPRVRRGALLHDIGKMGIPDAILLKPGPLTEKEWEIMRLHPSYAHKLLAPIAYLRDALDIPYCHHEKWNGTGYPRGLAGEAIPLAARVFALVDVWDALCSDRPYRAAWPPERAQQYLREQAGIHFDPRVVEMFLRLLESE